MAIRKLGTSDNVQVKIESLQENLCYKSFG